MTDLQNAENMIRLGAGGFSDSLMIVDDLFNPEWPGVSAGFWEWAFRYQYRRSMHGVATAFGRTFLAFNYPTYETVRRGFLALPIRPKREMEWFNGVPLLSYV